MPSTLAVPPESPTKASVRPGRRVCRTLGSTIAEFILPPHFDVPAHSHTPPHILVMLDGELTDVDGDKHAVCAKGSLRYAPGTDHHRVRISPTGAHCLVVEAQGFPELRLRQRHYVSAEECADLVDDLRRWFYVERSASPARIEDTALALFYRMRDLDRRTSAGCPPWITDVLALLDSGEPLAAPLADASRHVARSPSLVARTFRAHHAVSIHRYYRRRQVDRAWELLGDARKSLSAIAADCGFSDQSHLTRTFVRETGDTPSRLRAKMTAGSDRNWFLASPFELFTASSA